MKPDRPEKHKLLSRRELLKAGGAGALGILGAKRTAAAALPEPMDTTDGQPSTATRMSGETRTVHSVCLACNARCGIRGVVRDGRLVNISGNPYHPYNMQFSPIAPETDVSTAMTVGSPVCGKALDTPNHVYSPYRIIRPLKRSGPRGSGRFEPIAWEVLVEEICRGGRLFAHLGEKRKVPGIADLLSDEPVNPDDPGLGPQRNGLVFLTGRLQSGRKEFIDRFVKGAVGSKNRIGHTDICGLGFRMGNFAMSGGEQVELKADPKNADYILVFGANLYEALQPGINTYGAIVARRRSEGRLRFSIIDPRATRASVHAEAWIPVRPGKDGALAMGIIRWMIENDRVNRAYLRAPNPEAVKKLGFGVVSNASHLVICDPSHPDDGAMLRARHLAPSLSKGAGDDPMVFGDKKGLAGPASTFETAVLDREGAVQGEDGRPIRVKTAFRLLKEEAFSHTLEGYADACGVDAQGIARVAEAFSAHGTRAAVTQYHGAGNYVNGTYAAFAIAVLNVLVGSVNMKGGYLPGGGGCADPLKGPYDLKSFPGMRKGGGVAISREKADYEASAEYAEKKRKNGSGYPAKRPWFAFTKGGLCVEALAGIDERYPYGAQVLFTYLFNPIYSIPGGYRFKETLIDPEKVPLHVSLDVAVNESNIYADYIVPDLSFAEGHHGWLTPHAPGPTFTGIRTPMIEPLTEKTPEGKPICMETLLIDLALRLDLPGFGEKAIGDKDGSALALFTAEDYYLRAFANIAHGAGLAPAPAGEVDYVQGAYPISQCKQVLPENQWRQVCRLLSKGGVFTPYEAGFEGNVFKKGLSQVLIYNETLARSVNSMTGERFKGRPHWLAPCTVEKVPLDELQDGYRFTVVTYKSRLHTQSRSLWSRWAMEIEGENRVEMNPEDMKRLGLKDEDPVNLASMSNAEGIIGRVRSTALVRPGCVAVSFHFGHTQFGASPLSVEKAETVFIGGPSVVRNGTLMPVPRFAKGLNPNDVALLNPDLNRTPMVDPVSGIPDFSSTRVKIAKMAE
ncbi:MAG: molybdopterin-dependent oxidoreductase [Desulfatitalea sp.]|nr:molybdopterin-dependent oxidoreductase [Desulfatitalea sp.]NNJ99172.1 molybdopterin-dependent oxidoreductase [Desulfatitalea sp.]